MLRQNPEDEEEAVSAVRDDGIRQDGMGGGRLAPIADQAADTDIDRFRMPFNEIDQGSAIVSVDAQLAFAPTIRTSLRLWPETVHAVLKNDFSGSFFPDKLAINLVLSYHSHALGTMLSLEIRAMTLCEAWWCMEGEPDLCRDVGSSSFVVYI